MRIKKILSVVLIVVLVSLCIPVTGYAASATTPAKVTRDEAMTRLLKLKDALNGCFFTTTGSTCHTPAEKSHSCSKCNIGNVVAASWFKKKVDLVPNMSVVSISHYAPGGSTLKNGWSCCGFANFAGWYVYAQKSTDKVTFSKFYEGKDTKAQMAKSRPGDILRTSNGHSMVFIQNLANGTHYQVIDCNWCTVGSSVGNCKIQVRSIKYNTNTVAISRAKNLKDEVKLVSYLNYSGKNYLYDSDFTSINAKNWSTRDASVTEIFADSTNTHNGYNSLKIVNYSAGESGKDLSIRTMTQSRILANYIGDKRNLTLSFWAKASVSGIKMFFRWGHESTDEYRSVSFTTSWQKYTLTMDKVQTDSNMILPYINKAGTVWISEMQLEDGTSATSFVPEKGGNYQTVATTFGNNYKLPTEPTRSGYTFAGWYTTASGGSQITTSTAAKNGHITIYAHWNEIPASITSQPQSVSVYEGNTATFRVSAAGADLSYQWQYRTGSSGSWYNISGARSASYSFTAALSQNNYQYRCVVTTGSGNTLYSNVATLTVNKSTADPVDISGAEISFPGISYNDGKYWTTYSGSVLTPAVSVRVGGNTLTAGTDYNVYYSSNYEVGTAVVTISGKGNYAGSTNASFFICFKDVPLTHNFQKPVYWAFNEGIAAGYSGNRFGTFGVSDETTRGQVVMFLWRAAGQPNPMINAQTFSDVPTSHNFYKAIQWAYEQEIAGGYGGSRAGQFGPSDACKRGQIIFFLWKYAGAPTPANTTQQTFRDVPLTSNFFKAIQWAYEQGIAGGYTGARAGEFGISDPCTRGQCVTFLYRMLGQEPINN